MFDKGLKIQMLWQMCAIVKLIALILIQSDFELISYVDIV